MARCACGTGTCSCIVKAAPDGGVTVVGNGSASRPYLISVPGGNPLLNIDVVDSPTLDLTISGSGTATDKRRITGAATQSLTNLKDVQGTPTEGEIPVWRTNHWEFEAAAAAGLPVSGSWGTPPLDVFGTNSLNGREIYLDVNSQLRAKPDTINTGKLVTAPTSEYPNGVSVMTLAAAEGVGWPSGGSSTVVTYRRLSSDAAVAQWCYLNSPTISKAWYRNGNQTGWGPWVLVATSATPFISRSKTVNQALTAASTYYTIIFEADVQPAVGITYSGGVFTVPEDGIYLLDCALLCGSVATAQMRMSITATDPGQPAVNHGNPAWNGQGNSMLTYSRAIRIKAGGTLTISAWANTTGQNITGSSVDYTTMSLTKIAA